MTSKSRGFSRRILVSVTGMTPQVVTETLYAMVTAHEEIPTEIHLITTSHGRNRAIRDLLDSQTGQFHGFCRDFNLSGLIKFDASMIHVVCGPNGEEIPDIRTPMENSCAADLIVTLMRNFLSEENARVWVSLAGGRKTMGFFIGYALSLFGRPQDRLTHVLVSEKFENNRDFFYPSQTPKIIFSASGEPLRADEAEVMLADIPFVRLRDGLPEELLNGRCGYSETVSVAQQGVVPVEDLVFNRAQRSVHCGGTIIKFPPLLFAVFLWMAERRKLGQTSIRPRTRQDVEQFLDVYRRVVGTISGDYENAEQALKHEEDFLPYFQEKRTLINKKIKATLGIRASRSYLIRSSGKRPYTKYELVISPDAIKL